MKKICRPILLFVFVLISGLLSASQSKANEYYDTYQIIDDESLKSRLIYTKMEEIDDVQYMTYDDHANEETYPQLSMQIAYRTIEEIRAFINKTDGSRNQAVEYEEIPVKTAPYSPGKLSEKTLQSALNILNNVRYIAGIDADVTLNDEYNSCVQAGTLVNNLQGRLSHQPTQPEGMDDTLYQLAYKGTSHSNLASGFSNFGDAIVRGWLDDASEMEYGVGHRRWLLSPKMSQTGFGSTVTYASDSGSTSDYYYYGMYSFDEERECQYHYIAWPAQNTPVEYYTNSQTPWMLCTGYSEDEDSITVSLTRDSDGKNWTFNSLAADGKFRIASEGIGLDDCIIFVPDEKLQISAGDVYHVFISGLFDEETGKNDGVLSYDVNFFRLYNDISVDLSQQQFNLKVGEKIHLSDYVKITPADASSYVKWERSNQNVYVSSRIATVQGSHAGESVVSAYGPDGDLLASIAVNVESNKNSDSTTGVKTQESEDDTDDESDDETKVVRKDEDVVSKLSVRLKSIKTHYVAKKSPKNYIRFKWTKNKNCDGYQIKYTATKGTKKTKKYWIKNPNKTDYKIKNIVEGKEHRVKIRAYKIVDGKKYYGAWSNSLYLD
jgi:uncharacterized protein YkwD